MAPPDRTVLRLLALYACWGSAIPAMKLMVATVPPVGGAALIFLLAGVVLAGAARRRPRPTRGQLRRLAGAGVLLLVGGQGLATVALTEVTASLGAILAAAIPLWVVLLSGLTGTLVPVASWVRLVAGFGGIVIVVVTAPGTAFGGAPWAVAAFCVAPVLWAAGSLLTASGGRPVDRVVASAVQLLAGGTVLLLVALSLGQLDPARWQDVSWTSAAAAVFLLGFDSLAGFMLYTSLLESAPAPLVSTYAYITPLVGAVIGATVLAEPLWAGAFAGGALVFTAVALELRGPRDSGAGGAPSGAVLPGLGHEHSVRPDRGSRTVYSRSTTMLATTTKNEDSSTMPMITGRSCVVMDWTASAPRPGRPKMFSAITTPPRTIPRSMPAWVTIGVSELRGRSGQLLHRRRVRGGPGADRGAGAVLPAR